MPGSQNNIWNSYLNGGTHSYNFSYTDTDPLSKHISQNIYTNQNKPIKAPTTPNNIPQPSTSMTINKNQNRTKHQNGGKKSRRRTRHK